MDRYCSLVCGHGHVLDEELLEPPSLGTNGTRRCEKPGCSEFVYSHCDACEEPIPGWMDAPRRLEGEPILSGKLNRSIGPNREWREDCPYCKFPYPWARQRFLVDYHRRYLEEANQDIAKPLAHSPAAEEAHRQDQSAKRKRRIRRAGRSLAQALDTWPRRIKAVLRVIFSIMLVFFVNEQPSGLESE